MFKGVLVNIHSRSSHQEFKLSKMLIPNFFVFDLFVSINVIDFSKRRTTDLNNARVYFPKSKNFQAEAKIELLRIEAKGVIQKYVAENCGKGGGAIQESQ